MGLDRSKTYFLARWESGHELTGINVCFLVFAEHTNQGSVWITTRIDDPEKNPSRLLLGDDTSGIRETPEEAIKVRIEEAERERLRCQHAADVWRARLENAQAAALAAA
jgi:hypothetical protein